MREGDISFAEGHGWIRCRLLREADYSNLKAKLLYLIQELMRKNPLLRQVFSKP